MPESAIQLLWAAGIVSSFIGIVVVYQGMKPAYLPDGAAIGLLFMGLPVAICAVGGGLVGYFSIRGIASEGPLMISAMLAGIVIFTAVGSFSYYRLLRRDSKTKE